MRAHQAIGLSEGMGKLLLRTADQLNGVNELLLFKTANCGNQQLARRLSGGSALTMRFQILQWSHILYFLEPPIVRRLGVETRSVPNILHGHIFRACLQ